MPLRVGETLGAYEITGTLGSGGPSSARNAFQRELRRGLAEAKQMQCR